MKKFLLMASLLTATLLVKAQKVYFIYLQSEQDQAFFVRLNDKTYSSSASGYLILSHLRDSSYQFAVGFPGNKWPEQRFTVAVQATDHGYLLKNFGDKGWGLFDLQTLAVQMATNNTASAATTSSTEVSAFTDVLAKAAGDSSLRQKPAYVVAAEKAAEKAESKPAEAVQQPPVVNASVERSADTLPAQPVETPRTEAKVPEERMPPVVVKEGDKLKSVDAELTTQQDTVLRPSVITRATSRATDEGVAVTFVDSQLGGSRDTIQILIPGAPAPVVQVQPASDKKFLENISTDTTHPAAVTAAQPVNEQPAIVTPTKTEPVAVRNVYKTECKEVATEADFIKIRKKMVAEDNDDDMVDQARKFFKTKCFTTEQLRMLSTLFLQDIGKYKFFDMSYVFVSDPGNFPSLVSELKNDYYIKRFNAMLRN